MAVNYYTAEGLKKLKDELLELTTKGRKNMSKQIADARDKGDLSENAEYDAAKEAQGLMELKIKKLEIAIGNGRVLDESSVDTSQVSIMTTVKMRNKKSGVEVTYQIVAEEEADLNAKKISVQSPIGQGLLGKKKGEIAVVKAPAGDIEFVVLDITV